MIELPKTKVWTGDGFGANDARTMTQVIRSKNVAMYEAKTSSGDMIGYEVFKIKVMPKGTEIYGTIAEDDTEKYPCKGSFGLSAWFITGYDRAMDKFNMLSQEASSMEEDESGEVNKSKRGRKKIEREPLKFPDGEFSVNELAEFNEVTYVVAFSLMKEDEAAGKVKFVRSERRNAKGKETKLFQYAGK